MRIPACAHNVCYFATVGGVELLLAQGLPIAEYAAKAMNTKQAKVQAISNGQQCRLAGNSMHSSCVGLVVMYCVLFSKHNP
jgi:hypothetical protein